jgi:hypothetical protein
LVPVATIKVLAPPFSGIVRWEGVSVYRHVEPSWLIERIWSPTRMDPSLKSGDVFAATVYPIVPLPEPVAPLVIVIHGTVLVVVRSQLLALAVT